MLKNLLQFSITEYSNSKGNMRGYISIFLKFDFALLELNPILK